MFSEEQLELIKDFALSTSDPHQTASEQMVLFQGTRHAPKNLSPATLSSRSDE